MNDSTDRPDEGRGGPCPACRNAEVAPWFVKASALGSYPIIRCRSCRSAFVIPRPEQEVLERYYGSEAYRGAAGSEAGDRFKALVEAESRYPNSTLDAARMVSWCRSLASGDRFLDVGAGYGFFTREAVALGFHVEALEPAPSCREVFALMNGFEAEPAMLTAEFTSCHVGRYHVILMSQVLEHVPDLDGVLLWLRDLLAPEGLVAIAVPHFRSAVSLVQGKHDMFINPPEHVNFFTRRGLKALFAGSGFPCLHAETVSRFDPQRLTGKLRNPVLRRVGLPALRMALKATDVVGKGMYINAYFRKL